MDLSLKEYMYLAQTIYDDVQLKGAGMKSKEIEESIKKLKTYIRNIQAVARYMADICNSITQSTSMVRKIMPVNMETYPKATDHVCLRLSAREFVKEVATEEQIPIMNLYYIVPLKQYAINIGGIIIKGNLAEITEGSPTKKSFPCKKGPSCSEMRNGMCPFFHEPEHYLKQNMEVKNDRVLSNVSWIYDPKSNKSTRKIGGKSTLASDLMTTHSLNTEISTREYQLIHDLLVLLHINKKGLNERYHFWDVTFGLKNEKQ